MKAICSRFGWFRPPEPTRGGLKFSTFSEEKLLVDGALRDIIGFPNTELETTGPFEIADFGAVDRVAWRSGACAIPKSEVVFWGRRYMAWLAHAQLGVLDATRSLDVRLLVPLLIDDGAKLLAHEGRLWLWDEHRIVEIALAELEALFDKASGTIMIDVHHTYPQRRPTQSRKIHIDQIISDTMMAHDFYDHQSELWLPAIPGATVKMTATLYDELYSGHFIAIELERDHRIALEPEPIIDLAYKLTLTVEEARDPLAPIVTGDRPQRQADLDRLFRALADDPDESPEALLDLLEDSGEPYAPLLARLAAGETSDELRREALGPLGNFIEIDAYKRGLPSIATLREDAPLDPDITLAIAQDQRFGLLHTLHIGDGPFKVYASLVGSPRAVGLRHVDITHSSAVKALIAANRGELTHLSNVKLTTKETIEGLVHPTFDRVGRIHMRIGRYDVDSWMSALERDEHGFWKRAPRHLVIEPRGSFGDTELQKIRAAFSKLPLTGLTVTQPSLELVR